MMFLHYYHHCHYHHDHYRVLASPVLRRDVDVDVCVLAYDHDQCCNLGQGPPRYLLRQKKQKQTGMSVSMLMFMVTYY